MMIPNTDLLRAVTLYHPSGRIRWGREHLHRTASNPPRRGVIDVYSHAVGAFRKILTKRGSFGAYPRQAAESRSGSL